MQWTVQIIVSLLNIVWIVFFLQPDPFSVIVQRRSSDSSDEEMLLGEFCIQPPTVHSERGTQIDIAFLLDGSGSVSTVDFQRMKDFVKKVVSSFQGHDTKFAIVQFSITSTIHYYFDTFDANNQQTQIDGIRQLRERTYTASAIRRVVQDIFTPQRGSRSHVMVLIVITDGESNDRADLPNAVNLAEKKNIVRFAIGVGNAFSRTGTKQELNTIASSPPDDHVFRVESFETLEKIQQKLQDKIKEIEKQRSPQ